jgi:hypothetical protein
LFDRKTERLLLFQASRHFRARRFGLDSTWIRSIQRKAIRRPILVLDLFDLTPTTPLSSLPVGLDVLSQPIGCDSRHSAQIFLEDPRRVEWLTGQSISSVGRL